MADIEIAKKSDLNGKADTNHTHSEYASSNHNHTIANVTNLQASLDGKSDTGHTHSYNDLTEKPTIPSEPDLSGYATTGELSTELEGKSDTGHAHAYSEITGTPTIPADVSGEVEALRSELDALKLVVDGLVNPPEEPV